MSKPIPDDRLDGEKITLEKSAPHKPTHSRLLSGYDAIPILSAGPAVLPQPTAHDDEAVLEAQAGGTGLPPRMSTPRMVVLAAGMMMTYFVGVCHLSINC
jgi:hypothetical protein